MPVCKAGHEQHQIDEGFSSAIFAPPLPENGVSGNPPDNRSCRGESAAHLVTIRGWQHDSLSLLWLSRLAQNGELEICPVCYWEDDRQRGINGGPNNILMLHEARITFAELGASDLLWIGEVRPPLESER